MVERAYTYHVRARGGSGWAVSATTVVERYANEQRPHALLVFVVPRVDSMSTSEIVR